MTVNGEVRRSKFRKKITRKKCASAPFMMMEQLRHWQVARPLRLQGIPQREGGAEAVVTGGRRRPDDDPVRYTDMKQKLIGLITLSSAFNRNRQINDLFFKRRCG